MKTHNTDEMSMHDAEDAESVEGKRQQFGRHWILY